MRNLSGSLILVLLCAVALGQRQASKKEVCPIDFSKHTRAELIMNPPKNWNYACVTKELIDEIVTNETYVVNILECIKDVQLCKGAGYEIIADEVLNRISAGGECTNCSSDLVDLAQYTLRQLQRNFPHYVREGLAYLA